MNQPEAAPWHLSTGDAARGKVGYRGISDGTPGTRQLCKRQTYADSRLVIDELTSASVAPERSG